MKSICLSCILLTLVSCAQNKFSSESNPHIDIPVFRDNMPVVPPDPIPKIKANFQGETNSDVIPVYYIVGDNRSIIYEAYVIITACPTNDGVYLGASNRSIVFDYDYEEIRKAGMGDTLFLTRLRFPSKTLRQQSIVCNKVEVAFKSEYGWHKQPFNHPFEIKNEMHTDLILYITF